MVFSPFPPPVPSLPLVLREVSATGSLRKMGRRHSFFETLDTAALLTDSPPKGFRRFLACSPPPRNSQSRVVARRSLQVWPSYAAWSARVAMRGVLA
jgi:hypothetical protein